MKKYMVYSIDLKEKFEEQEPKVLAICDTPKEAQKVCDEFNKQTEELVRIKEFDDADTKTLETRFYIVDADAYEKYDKQRKVVLNVGMALAMAWGYFVGVRTGKKANS